MPAPRAQRERRTRARAEYSSAAITAQAVPWMIVCGLPDPLLRTGLRIVADELDHARLAHEVVVAIDGEDAAEPVVLAEMHPPERGIDASLLDCILRSFYLGDTLSVPLFAAMPEGTTHPVARSRAEQVLPRFFESFERAYVHLPAHVPLSGAELGAGLITAADYAAITAEALETDVIPRFARPRITAAHA